MSKVLIVDDSRLSVAALQNMIQRIGYDVVGVAYNGEEAIKKVNMLKPDIVTLDFVMPDINGADVAKKIRNIHPSIKIIMITNDELPAETKNEINANAYVLKPITVKKLEEAFSSV